VRVARSVGVEVRAGGRPTGERSTATRRTFVSTGPVVVS